MSSRVHAEAKAAPKSSFSPVRTGLLQCSSTSYAGPATAPPIVHEVLRSPGQLLDPQTRAFIEPRFRHDFSGVRVHTDAKAAESARAVNARAYTVGQHVVFGAGQYALQSLSGKQLLAHELAHVMQQGYKAPGSYGQDISDPADSLEHEAEDAASRLMHGLSPSIKSVNSSHSLIHRVPETWFRGEATGVGPAARGGVIHDLGDGFYLTNDRGVAARYATMRAGGQPSTGRIISATFERSLLGRVLDLTRDRRWQLYMQTRTPTGVTHEQLIRQANQNYRVFFQAFLVDNNMRLVSFDAIIGPEYVRGGTQVCIRNPSIASQIRTMLQPVPPGAPAVQQRPGENTSTRVAPPAEFRVNTQFRVLNTTPQSGGNTVSEVEVLLGEGLERVNRTVRANGGRTLPSRLVLHITTNAQGALVAAESATGESTVLAETLARQALDTAPRAATGAARGVSPWVRGVGWAGIVLFLGITAIQYHEATPEQRPRVLVTAGGGLAGGMLTGYVICNVVLGIETLGWSLLICGFIAGIPGAFGGAEIAGGIYDVATATPVQRALHDLQGQPVNVRRLFYAMVEQSTSHGGLAVTEEFIREFIISVPSNLADDELATLTGQMGRVGPSDTLRNILTRLRRAIDQLPRRQPVRLPPMLHITDIHAIGERGSCCVYPFGSGRIRILPPMTPPRPGEELSREQIIPTQPLLEIQF